MMKIRTPRHRRGQKAALLAILLLAGGLVGCSGSTGDNGDKAVSSVATADTADTAPSRAAKGENLGLLTGIPIVAGERSHDRKGTRSKGGTSFRAIGVKTGQPWEALAAKVRADMHDAGLGEETWVVSRAAPMMQGMDAERVRAAFTKGELFITVKIDSAGNVDYDIREMPAGSAEEKNFVCDSLRALGPALLRLNLAVSRKQPVTADQVAFLFAWADTLQDEVPASLWSAEQALHQAVAASAGAAGEAYQPDAAAKSAISKAQAALKAETGKVCAV